jgi:histidinol-phosphate phosphatase family protein
MTPFEVAILAGGAGSRLKSRTGPLPKPMVPILGTPLLEHQIALCRRHGFGRILLLVHHTHEQIRAHFGDGSTHGVSVGYALEATPRGTAGALHDALPSLLDTFLVLYGDTYLDVDLRRMWDVHVKRAADATLFVHPNDHPHDSDLVELDDRSFVTALHPYPHRDECDRDNLATAALFVMERRGFEGMASTDAPADLARDGCAAMLRAGRRLYGYVSAEYIKDVGTPERLDQVEHDVTAGVPERLSGRTLRSAVFLDRDGTLNREVHHLKAPEQIELLGGAADAVRRINRTGCLAIVVTNQPAVARGDMTPTGLERVHRRLKAMLGRQGAYLDAIFACPHHPDDGFPGEVRELKIQCECRKPRTGLIDAACRDLTVDRSASWMVGDTTSDIETGRRAGLRTILVRTGYAGQDGKHPFRPDYVASDLEAAVAWILDGHPSIARQTAPIAVAALDARILLIGGLARSGKSSVAQVLKESVHALDRTAHVLSLDSWLKPQTERAEGEGVTTRFDLDRLAAAIKPLIGSARRHSIDVPIYDRARRAMYDRSVHISIGPDDLIIVEGVPALVDPNLVKLAHVRVHVEMPEVERIARLRADYRWRGESDAAVNALIASRAADESEPVQAARAHADFTVTAWTGA